ncbi:MAG: hypothetical protein M3155_04370 [Actinomycetota bacterium]|nr:hypothetical protein [Actinomycetota bacterium]
MSAWAWALVAVGVLAVARAGLALARRLKHPLVARAVIASATDHTTIEPNGAVRTVQSADLRMPADRLDAIWTPMHLERLARTYWRFLRRVTLGVIRVSYTPEERFVVLLTRPFVLLRFQAPEYLMDGHRGIVRWRIERGLLVTREGRGKGYLQIDIRRSEPGPDGWAIAHVEVEVANFYPWVARAFSTWAYQQTQSRIHVLVTHGFLRSLARLDLATSRVGRLAQATLPEGTADQLPDPPEDDRPARDREGARLRSAPRP